MHSRFRRPAVAAFGLACAVSSIAAAAPKQGEIIQTDSVGVSLITRDSTIRKTTTVSDVTNLSEYVGVHYYVIDRVRLGVTFQFQERIRPEPEAGQTRLQRLALSPQIGYNFMDPLFVGVIYGIVPYSHGEKRFDMTVEPFFGVGVPITKRVKWSVTAVAPYAFYQHRTIGLTLITGIALVL